MGRARPRGDRPGAADAGARGRAAARERQAEAQEGAGRAHRAGGGSRRLHELERDAGRGAPRGRRHPRPTRLRRRRAPCPGPPLVERAGSGRAPAPPRRPPRLRRFSTTRCRPPPRRSPRTNSPARSPGWTAPAASPISSSGGSPTRRAASSTAPPAPAPVSSVSGRRRSRTPRRRPRTPSQPSSFCDWAPILENEHYRAAGERTLGAFAGAAELGVFAATWLRGLDFLLNGECRIVVADTTTNGSLLTAALAAYRPRRVVVHSATSPVPGRPAPVALVCAGTVCAAPVSDGASLRATLETFGARFRISRC